MESLIAVGTVENMVKRVLLHTNMMVSSLS